MILCISCGDKQVFEPPYTLIPGVGLEELKLGDTGLKVTEQFGDPEIKSSVNGSLTTHSLEYFSEGLKFYFDPVASSDVDFNLPITQIIAFGKFAGNTDKGIIIGSSLQQVRVLYGEPNFFDEILNQDQYSSGIDFCYDIEDFINEIKVR